MLNWKYIWRAVLFQIKYLFYFNFFVSNDSFMDNVHIFWIKIVIQYMFSFIANSKSWKNETGKDSRDKQAYPFLWGWVNLRLTWNAYKEGKQTYDKVSHCFIMQTNEIVLNLIERNTTWACLEGLHWTSVCVCKHKYFYKLL